MTGVHSSQISRIENGQFARTSRNVQKLQKFFDELTRPPRTKLAGLGERVEAIAAQSSRHELAIRALLEMLEDTNP